MYNYPYAPGTYGAGSIKLFNNTVSNITIQGSSTSTTNILYGIYNYNYPSTSTMEIYGNTVKNITMGSNTTTNTGTVCGLYLIYGNNAKAYNNLINNITAYKGGNIQGIYTAFTDNFSLYNNFVTDLATPNATNSATSIAGININSINTAGSTLSLSHNTIDFGSATATSTVANYGASGIYWNAGNLNLRNNIINVKYASGRKNVKLSTILQNIQVSST